MNLFIIYHKKIKLSKCDRLQNIYRTLPKTKNNVSNTLKLFIFVHHKLMIMHVQVH